MAHIKELKTVTKYRAQILADDRKVIRWVDGGLFGAYNDALADIERLALIYGNKVRIIEVEAVAE
jgi:hypothetical protein